MYLVYLDGLLFPIAPQKITTTIKGKNKTIDLINESEVNTIRGLKLTDYAYDLRLPNRNYPFAIYENGYQDSNVYLDKLSSLKTSQKPFEMLIIMTTTSNRGDAFQEISANVTLENYTIYDDVAEGIDKKVEAEFKAYKPYGTTKVKVKKKTKNGKSKKYYTKIKLTTKKKKIVNEYTTKVGDTLFLISKKVYGKYTENNCKAIYQKNKGKSAVKTLVNSFTEGAIKGDSSNTLTKRAYTRMEFGAGIKLVIPQNKEG